MENKSVWIINTITAWKMIYSYLNRYTNRIPWKLVRIFTQHLLISAFFFNTMDIIYLFYKLLKNNITEKVYNAIKSVYANPQYSSNGKRYDITDVYLIIRSQTGLLYESIFVKLFPKWYIWYILTRQAYRGRTTIWSCHVRVKDYKHALTNNTHMV